MEMIWSLYHSGHKFGSRVIHQIEPRQVKSVLNLMVIFCYLLLTIQNYEKVNSTLPLKFTITSTWLYRNSASSICW